MFPLGVLIVKKRSFYSRRSSLSRTLAISNFFTGPLSFPSKSRQKNTRCLELRYLELRYLEPFRWSLELIFAEIMLIIFLAEILKKNLFRQTIILAKPLRVYS